jgi:hypothetical protein
MSRRNPGAVIFFLCVLCVTAYGAGEPSVAGGLPEIALDRLADQSVSPLGQAALAINPTQWKHAETANFAYHFTDNFIATPVSVEAEFYYSAIAKELERDTSHRERKCHIYIFEKPEDWKIFQKNAALEPWTGGILSDGDLFIVRNPQFKFKGRALGHEVAHLVLFRFFGNGIPLWLNEGYAEDASSRFYASFMRARQYDAKPLAPAVAAADYIPLDLLTRAPSYPPGENRVIAFYAESQRLVRFLMGVDARRFEAFLEEMSKGARFGTALQQTFGGRFMSLDALEREFKDYATKDYAAPPPH